MDEKIESRRLNHHPSDTHAFGGMFWFVLGLCLLTLLYFFMPVSFYFPNYDKHVQVGSVIHEEAFFHSHVKERESESFNALVDEIKQDGLEKDRTAKRFLSANRPDKPQ